MSGATAVRLTFACPFGPVELMAIPPCPHPDCGWFMPQLSCPVHGNFGMTYQFVRQGSITRVRAVLDIPREPLPDEIPAAVSGTEGAGA